MLWMFTRTRNLTTALPVSDPKESFKAGSWGPPHAHLQSSPLEAHRAPEGPYTHSVSPPKPRLADPVLRASFIQ